MAVLIGVLLAAVFLALEWFVRAALLTPLPEEVRCVFSLDDASEPKLEACVRSYRFLRKHGLVRGGLTIEVGEASGRACRAAQILARRGDITVVDTKE